MPFYLDFPDFGLSDSTLQHGTGATGWFGSPGAGVVGSVTSPTLAAYALLLPTGQIIEVAQNIASQVAAQTGATIGEFRTLTGSRARNAYRSVSSAVNAARKAMQSGGAVPPSTDYSSYGGGGGLFGLDTTTLLLIAGLALVVLLPRD